MKQEFAQAQHSVKIASHFFMGATIFHHLMKSHFCKVTPYLLTWTAQSGQGPG